MSRRAPTIAAEAATRMRPWVVHLTTYTGLAVWAMTGVTVASMAAAVAWHLIRWAWRSPEQPVVAGLVVLAAWAVYRWDREASGVSRAAEDDAP